MSNIAPHSRFKFDKNKHIWRQDILFLPPGAHILLKWTKTLQDSSAHHFVQIQALKNSTLCQVRAIKKLLRSRDISPPAPLFAHNSPPFYPVIDTTIRNGLRKVLTHLRITLVGHGFNTFRRSGATLAYDNNIQLQHIMAYGLWQSAAVWTYLQNASLTPSITFHYTLNFCGYNPLISLIGLVQKFLKLLVFYNTAILKLVVSGKTSVQRISTHLPPCYMAGIRI